MDWGLWSVKPLPCFPCLCHLFSYSPAVVGWKLVTLATLATILLHLQIHLESSPGALTTGKKACPLSISPLHQGWNLVNVLSHPWICLMKRMLKMECTTVFTAWNGSGHFCSSHRSYIQPIYHMVTNPSLERGFPAHCCYNKAITRSSN